MKLTEFEGKPVAEALREMQDGDRCPVPNCPGTLILPNVVNCSCHTGVAPCSACTDNQIECDRCHFLPQAPDAVAWLTKRCEEKLPATPTDSGFDLPVEALLIPGATSREGLEAFAQKRPTTLRELRAYLDRLVITSENIGAIRNSLFLGDTIGGTCQGSKDNDGWNGLVREETAERENKPLFGKCECNFPTACKIDAGLCGHCLKPHRTPALWARDIEAARVDELHEKAERGDCFVCRPTWKQRLRRILFGGHYCEWPDMSVAVEGKDTMGADFYCRLSFLDRVRVLLSGRVAVSMRAVRRDCEAGPWTVNMTLSPLPWPALAEAEEKTQTPPIPKP